MVNSYERKLTPTRRYIHPVESPTKDTHIAVTPTQSIDSKII